ncbi:MAG: argininosuccinate lyase, partial [Cyclobacteriaceae bacterium]|nr:argininosuccinate lyase [Cyclobacteriaceae bacterium]
SVELVNQLVLGGIPFRDAYVEVGRRIEKGEFEIPSKLDHTHEGSLGNLCNDKIEQRFQFTFNFFEEQRILISSKFKLLLV